MKKIVCSFLLLLSSTLLFAEADKGVVCLKVRGCDYMIVCTNNYYAVVEDYYDNCEEGDVLIADFKSYGFRDAYNLTRSKSVRVYIEDWEYSENSAVSKWKNKCR